MGACLFLLTFVTNQIIWYSAALPITYKFFSVLVLNKVKSKCLSLKNYQLIMYLIALFSVHRFNKLKALTDNIISENIVYQSASIFFPSWMINECENA